MLAFLLTWLYWEKVVSTTTTCITSQIMACDVTVAEAFGVFFPVKVKIITTIGDLVLAEYSELVVIVNCSSWAKWLWTSKKIGPVEGGRFLWKIDASFGDWRVIDIYSASTYWCLGSGCGELCSDEHCNATQTVKVVRRLKTANYENSCRICCLLAKLPYIDWH